MCAEGLLTRLIRNHPDTWERELTSRGVQVTGASETCRLPWQSHSLPPYPEMYDLAIASYNQLDPRCDFTDPLVRECRGIIFDTETGEVTCRPFDKFGNWFESYADHIDWGTAIVTEKLDGQLIKLWHRFGKWIWSTNKRADSRFSVGRLDARMSAYELIHKAENFDQVHLERLDEGTTYLFELTSPHNQVVVAYPTTRLTHIGTRDNATGAERDDDIGVDRPRRRSDIRSLDEAIALAQSLNDEDVRHEGLVVTDCLWRRNKVKNELYLKLHHTMSRRVLSPKVGYAALMANDEETLRAWRTMPTMRDALDTYRRRMQAAEERTMAAADLIREAFERTGTRREAIAATDDKDVLPIAIVMALEGKSWKDATARMRPKALMRIFERMEQS